jgi:hypothetical protein
MVKRGVGREEKEDGKAMMRNSQNLYRTMIEVNMFTVTTQETGLR